MESELKNFVAYFPEVFDSETVYSVCARLARMTGGRTAYPVLDEFLLARSSARHVAVPTALALLESASAGAISATETTLRTRSILGAFYPVFTHAKRLAITRLCQKYGPATAVNARVGLNRYPSCGDILKFCPACIRDQMESGGMTFWTTEHQLPGVWICTRHAEILCFSTMKRRRSTWLLPQDCLDRGARETHDTRMQLRMLRLQEAMSWIVSQHSLNLSALTVMIKLRLRLGGLCRSELKWHSSEARHLNALACEHYEEMLVPDVQERNGLDWLSMLFSDGRNFHPIPWAMAIAWVGSTDVASLEREYLEALMRKPQGDLFDEMSRRAHRTQAPMRLYQAIRDSISLSDAQSRSGLDLHEVNGWLRKDPMLRAEWDALCTSRRRLQCIEEIRGFLKKRPDAMRIDVLRACSSAYRWLQSKDNHALQRLLPPAVTRQQRQYSFDW